MSQLDNTLLKREKPKIEEKPVITMYDYFQSIKIKNLENRK